MYINNGSTTPPGISSNASPQLLSSAPSSSTTGDKVNDASNLANNLAPKNHLSSTVETVAPPTQSKESSEHRQSSAYLLSIGSQQQQTSLTYSAKSQYSENTSSSSTTVTNTSTTTITASSAISEPPPLLDGAKNILHFIEQRVASEQAAGADLETLDTLLQQGLAGFVQGYDEARAILGEQESLSDTVDDSISLLYQQVVDGINDLRHSYLGEEKVERTPAASQEATPTVTANPISSDSLTKSNSISSLASPVNDLLEQLSGPQDSQILTLLDSLEEIDNIKEYAAEYAETQQFTFTLTTADGDTVSINANRSSSASGYSNQSNQNRLDMMQTNQQQQFSFAINGDLDEGEMEAINHLMQQVMSLSEQFYNGDIGEAYQAALEMDYDSSEITSYALQLKQTESYEVAAIYDEIAPSTFSPTADLHSVFEKIGDYTQQVLQEILKGDDKQSSHYAKMIENLSSQLDQQLERQLGQNKEKSDTPANIYRFSDSIANMIESAGINEA